MVLKKIFSKRLNSSTSVEVSDNYPKTYLKVITCLLKGILNKKRYCHTKLMKDTGFSHQIIWIVMKTFIEWKWITPKYDGRYTFYEVNTAQLKYVKDYWIKQKEIWGKPIDDVLDLIDKIKELSKMILIQFVNLSNKLKSHSFHIVSIE